MLVKLNVDLAEKFVKKSIYDSTKEKAIEFCRKVYETPEVFQGVNGWFHVNNATQELDLIKSKAYEVRKNADVFVIIGVGGSNMAARAVVKALKNEKSAPEILYAGNTMSAHYVKGILDKLKGKSVYINVIAKNFETIEPGSHFRIFRQYLQERYDRDEVSKRIILTGTKGQLLQEMAEKEGYTFLPFPRAIGGRFSVFSPVALFPIAVAGLSIDAYIEGAAEVEEHARCCKVDSPIIMYAALRNCLYAESFNVEMISAFEPRLEYFLRWWIQMFGESEGKEHKGIFPSGAIYSEDLHAIGQYVQEGRRSLMESFITIEDPGASLLIKPDDKIQDKFDYLNGKDLAEINKVVEKATIDAHVKGGVPCFQFRIKKLDEKTFGALYYFFMVSCVVSGQVLGINPFNQEGVEEYKRSMFKLLGRR